MEDECHANPKRGCKLDVTLLLVEVTRISTTSAYCPQSIQYFFQSATRLEQVLSTYYVLMAALGTMQGTQN